MARTIAVGQLIRATVSQLHGVLRKLSGERDAAVGVLRRMVVEDGERKLR